MDAVGKAVDKLQDYSYQFNAKIINVSEIKHQETARETSDLCVALFNGMGAVVSLQDLDVAHRVPRRDQDGGPKPIICKFIRRLAKSEVMNRRRDACKGDYLFIYYYYFIPFLHLVCNVISCTSDVLYLYYFSTCYVNALRATFQLFSSYFVQI